MTQQATLRAVLWDMDGTIVDTEPFWIEAEKELIASFGGAWSHEQALQCVGLGLDDSARLFQDAGVRMPIPEIVAHLTDAVMVKLQGPDVVFRPGARELLEATRSAGLQNVLVTMSHRRMALLVASLIPGDVFSAVVAGDDVARPKPFPDPYLQALESIGASAVETVAIEDSPTGVRSAVAAGLATIGVPHLLPLDGLGATVIWPTLAERGIPDLTTVLQEHHV